MGGMREIYLGGNFIDAGRASASFWLKKGNSVIVFPGGASESFYPCSDDEPLVLRNRQGFIQLARKHKATIIPVFTFGESDLFEPPIRQTPAVFTGGVQISPAGADKNSWGWKIQKMLQRTLGLAFPLAGLLGGNTKTVVGRPFKLREDESDSDALSRYEKELLSLHKRHAEVDTKGLRFVENGDELTVL